MKDRVPVNPGRVLITPENGAAAFYATMTRADNPTQEGDPLCKDTLLKDATAALYGLSEAAVPDDVLALLKPLVDNAQTSADARAQIEYGTYTGTDTGNGSISKKLTFSFNPQLVIIYDTSNNYIGIFVKDCKYGNMLKGSLSNAAMYSYGFNLTWGDKQLTFKLYSNYGSDMALNKSGYTYKYVAIG